MKTLQKKFPAALLLVGLLALLALTPAVRALTVGEKGSIALALSPVQPDDAEGQAKHDAIAATDFTGRLYQIATVDANYTYTAAADFAALTDDGIADFKDMNAENTATLAEHAAALAAEAEPAETLTVSGGTAKAADLATGLYLLVIDEFTTADGVWTVTSEPVLLPVPVVTGYVGESWDGSDNYDVEATLKLQAEKALTKIKITKQLNDYSALQGPASFVFRVDAVNAKGENVFSNVYSMTFTGAGTQELTVENIPVDSEVTVTEVYSGAAYTPDGSGEVKLTAKPMQKGDDGSETLPEENTASFTNNYSRRRTYGTTVTNAFSYAEDRWQLVQNYSDR